MRIPMKFLRTYPVEVKPEGMKDGQLIKIVIDDVESMGVLRSSAGSPETPQNGLLIELTDPLTGASTGKVLNLSQEVVKTIKREQGEGIWKLLHSTAYKGLIIPERFRQKYPEAVKPPKMKDGAIIFVKQKKAYQRGIINAVGKAGPVLSGVVVSLENEEAPLFTYEEIHLPQEVVNTIKNSPSRGGWTLTLPSE